MRSLGGSVRERHESRYVFPLSRRRYPSVCVPRGMWNETGAGVFELPVQIVLHNARTTGKNGNSRLNFLTFGAGTDRGHDDRDCTFRAPETPEVCRTVHLVERARLRSLVVGGNPGSCAVVFPIPRVKLLEERPAVPGRREKTQREEL